MGEYHLMRDGNVAVRLDDGRFYLDTIVNFVADGGPQPDALPNGADERIYTQGRRHALQKDSNVIDGGPMPWPDGDAVIAAGADYIAAKEERDAAPPPLAEHFDMGSDIKLVITR